MSLILEALKKSEAERRLGQVPGLMTPVQRASAPRRSVLPWVIVAVLIAATGAFGWWWTQMRDDAAPVEPAAIAAPESAPTPAPVAPVQTQTPAAPAPEPALARTPAIATPDLPAPLPEDPDFVSTERESRPVPADAAALPPPPAALPRTAPPRDRPSPAVTSPAPDRTAAQPTPAPTPTAETPSTPPAPPPAAVAPEPPVAAVAEPEPEPELLPRITELLPAQRDALPALKMTMLVYAADPAARFAIIDGRRHVEGERLDATLTLREIRRDGVVLESEGRRFLLPRL